MRAAFSGGSDTLAVTKLAIIPAPMSTVGPWAPALDAASVRGCSTSPRSHSAESFNRSAAPDSGKLRDVVHHAGSHLPSTQDAAYSAAATFISSRRSLLTSGFWYSIRSDLIMSISA